MGNYGKRRDEKEKSKKVCEKFGRFNFYSYNCSRKKPIGLYLFIKMERKDTKKEGINTQREFQALLARGYDAVSFTDIEREAKVTRGAIFHHFDNKEDLFRHVAETVCSFAFLEDVDNGEEYLSSPTPLKAFMDKCLTIIETRMEYFLQGVDADVTSASFMSFIFYLKDHYETWEEKVQIYEEKKIQTWVNAINLSKDRKEICPNADTTLLAETFHHLYLGLSFKGAMIDNLSVSVLRKQWEYIYEQQLIK